MYYKDFLRECLRWAYGRWRGWHVVVSIPLAIITALGLTGVIVSFFTWSNLIYLLVVPIVMVFFIAPYKLLKQKASEIEQLTTKRLELANEETGEVYTNQNIWNHLKVMNKTDVAIKGCYGQLVRFLDLSSKNLIQVPPNSIRYAWTTNRGGSNCRTSDIGPHSWDYLDIMWVDGINNMLYTPVLQQDNWTRHLLYPIPPGKYQLEIQVGSEVEDILPEKIKLMIEYNGGLDFRVQKVS